LYGWTADEVVGRNIGEATVPPWDADAAEAIMAQLREGKAWSGEFSVRRKDDSTFIAHITDSPVFDESGALVAIVGVSRDVTERRRREDTLLRNQERIELLFDAARIGSWSQDRASRRIQWDPAMEALCGLEPGTFGGTRAAFAALVHPDDHARLVSAFPDDRDWSGDVRVEHRVVWSDGSVHWIEQRGRGIVDDTGAPIGMVGIGINIDDRKRVEAIEQEAASLRTTAGLVAQLQEAERIAKLGSWYWDADNNLVTLSREMAALLDTDERLTGQDFRTALEQLAHPDDTGILYDAPIRAIETRQPFVLEQRLLIGSEERLYLHRGEADLDDDGDVVGLRGTTQDITDERRAEERLLATTRRLVEERRAVVVLREALVRPDFPTLPGYDFAAMYLAAEHHPDLGGDWYDAFLVPDGRLMISIGDLSGHGIVAARFMAKLRHATRAYACFDPDPATVLANLHAFVHHFVPDHFATIQVALMTPTTGEITMVSAGHPPPLHRAGDGTSFVQVENAPPAGVFTPDTSPQPATIRVGPDQALIFYTDGLVERRGESLDEGFARLADATRRARLSTAAHLVNNIVQECLAGVDQTDDTCVLVIKRDA
jgi:PAS domain S-box-containing protein